MITASPSDSAPLGRRWIWISLAWVAAVLFGFGLLLQEKSAPGPTGAAPPGWPAASALPRRADRLTLLMFVHPRCACSRASLVELGRLLRQPGGERVAATVVFVRPKGAGADFAVSELREQAARLPGVALADDLDGREAERFGAATSGAVVVYDAAGALAFSGGLTQLRGHEGRSFGGERLAALLNGRVPDRRDSPVFGCGLFQPEAERSLDGK